MRKRSPWLMVMIAICFLALAQIACDPTPDPDPDPPDPGEEVRLPSAARGGGWIISGDGKATFGFQLTCDEETGAIKGQFQYKDHAQNVGFHGVVQDESDGCMVPGTELFYEGRYTPQPKNLGDPGDLVIALAGEGCLSVTLSGGVHGGYSHSGCLEGGNVQFWLASD